VFLVVKALNSVVKEATVSARILNLLILFLAAKLMVLASETVFLKALITFCAVAPASVITSYF